MTNNLSDFFNFSKISISEFTSVLTRIHVKSEKKIVTSLGGE